MKLEEIIADISTILMKSDLSLESQKRIMDGLKKEIYDTPKAETCIIFGVDKVDGYNIKVPTSDLLRTCSDICDDPRQYWGHISGENAYYDFLKFLWVRYPDGKEVQMVTLIGEAG